MNFFVRKKILTLINNKMIIKLIYNKKYINYIIPFCVCVCVSPITMREIGLGSKGQRKEQCFSHSYSQLVKVVDYDWNNNTFT